MKHCIFRLFHALKKAIFGVLMHRYVCKNCKYGNYHNCGRKLNYNFKDLREACPGHEAKEEVK